jgi:nucleotide-binding universal stress UspA family protein
MKILITADGSEASRQAVEQCSRYVSAEKHTDIKIVSVVEHLAPMAAEPFAVSAEYCAQIESDLRKAAREAVADAEKTISEKFAEKDVHIQTEVFTGNVKQTIVDEAEKFKADLIVVGSHGYGFLDRVLLGSISDFVVHHAPCSVLVVRKTAAAADD